MSSAFFKNLKWLLGSANSMSVTFRDVVMSLFTVHDSTRTRFSLCTMIRCWTQMPWHNRGSTVWLSNDGNVLQRTWLQSFFNTRNNPCSITRNWTVNKAIKSLLNLKPLSVSNANKICSVFDNIWRLCFINNNSKKSYLVYFFGYFFTNKLFSFEQISFWKYRLV